MELTSNWSSGEAFDFTHSTELYTDSIPEALSDLLNEEKCFILNQCPGNKNICTLTLTCKNEPSSVNSKHSGRTKVDALCVVSESKLVEVFIGEYEEYFGCFAGTVVENFADSLLCRTDIDLKSPQSIVKLLFKKAYEESSLMIYGIFAKISLVCDYSSKFSSNPLNESLANHGVKLSKEAEIFKHVLEQYNDSSKASNSSISGFMPLLYSMNSSTISHFIDRKPLQNSWECSSQKVSCNAPENFEMEMSSAEPLFSASKEEALAACLAVSKINISPADGQIEMNNNSQDELEEKLTKGNNSILNSNTTEGIVSLATLPFPSAAATIFESIIDRKMTQFENKLELLIEGKFSELSIKILEKLNAIENANKCNCQL